jgi:hypothetical protein
MLLLSPPQCYIYPPNGVSKQTTFTSQRASLPVWSARPAASLVALHSLQQLIFLQSTSQPRSTLRKPRVSTAPDSPPPTPPISQMSTNTTAMSIPSDAYYGSPRSPFSPTLDSIQEVFEYEPLEETSPPPTPLTPLETPHAVSPFILPEAATLIAPTLFRGEEIEGIFAIPRKSQTAVASFKVANVLRRVLEADRLRRRRALRIYLKAIVFLKLLLKSHERYGALMATSGAYMQR